MDRRVGDAVMVTFNTRGDQPDHPLRAARAAPALQEATAAIAAAHPGWPPFRVGVNSGQAAIGILGTAGGRTFTVIGDTVNLAARLEGKTDRSRSTACATHDGSQPRTLLFQDRESCGDQVKGLLVCRRHNQDPSPPGKGCPG